MPTRNRGRPHRPIPFPLILTEDAQMDAEAPRQEEARSRRLPAKWGVIADPRDVTTIRVDGADVRLGWFVHEDGEPLWFAEWRSPRSHLCVMGYGDSRDEALRDALDAAIKL